MGKPASEEDDETGPELRVHRRYLTASGGIVLALACAVAVARAAPGSFAMSIYVVPSWPKAVAVADVTGDGRTDVLATTAFRFDAENDFRLFVFEQAPDGTLTTTARLPTHALEDQTPHSMGIATGDMDGDGANDAAVATHGGVDIYLQRAGQLEPAGLLAGTSGADLVEVVDLDRDGRNDLVVSTRQPGTWPVQGKVLVARNTGAAFAVSTIHSGFYQEDLDLGDLNGDGLLDVVGYSLERLPTPLNTFLQQPDRGWSLRTYAGDGDLRPYSLSAGEFTGDGRTDVALGHGHNGGLVLVFPQTAAGELAAPARHLIGDEPEAMTAQDLDGDGREDLVYYHDGNPWFPVAIGALLQEAPGSLRSESYRLGLYPANHLPQRGLAVGDVDGNRAADIVFADYNEGLVVLRQDAAAAPSPPPAPPAPPSPASPPPAPAPSPAPLPVGSPPAAPPPASGRTVGQGPSRYCVVPRLVGKTLVAARRALNRGGCRLGRLRTAQSTRVPTGHVLAQSPKPRTRLRRGARVALTVCRR